MRTRGSMRADLFLMAARKLARWETSSFVAMSFAAAFSMNEPVFSFASALAIERAMVPPSASPPRSGMGTGDGRVAVVGALGRGVERGGDEGPSRMRPTEAARGREEELVPALGPLLLVLGRRGRGVPRGRGTSTPGDRRASSFLWLSISASTIAVACWSAAICICLGVSCCCSTVLGSPWSCAA